MLHNASNFYINGEWVAPSITQDTEVINPSTGEVCAVISLGSEEDTNSAVGAAKATFDSWSQTDKATRISLVERILVEYKRRADDMALAISTEMGAPIDKAKDAQVPAGTWHIENSLRVARAFEFSQMLGDHAPNDRIVYEAAGVCALITPWNWPMNQVTLKVIPALLAGCTMVLKPSEIAPLSSVVFSEIMHAAGVPAGVYNMVHGDGDGVGTQLSRHPDIDVVSFTGSSRAGIAISINAAPTLKRVHLELGGKGANIVFADAPEKSVKRGIIDCFGNSGQSCNAPSRMLVERSIYDQAIEDARNTAAMMKVGNATQTGRILGPVVSAQQYEKIQRLIKAGIDEGARLVAGGLGHPENVDPGGYYVKPTVFADVNNDMTIAREEIFGPVICLIPFDTEEEAIAIANDTVYGLTNYVQSTDDEKRVRVARQLRSGMVQMNNQSLGACSPFGGMKQSGNGREGGIWGLQDFLEVKAVSGWAG
ncbi:MAG: aldehyde dehydrogenase family protein [Alphaproteobacteria bacterium]|nr:aldehyde dehydrogenase family protein [Alphaproteobacteria bacterium]